VANDFEMSDEVRIRTLYAEIEQLKAELADTLLGPTMVQNLRAENERLKADNERLTDDLAMARADWNNTVDLKNKLRDEIERLRAALRMIAGQEQCLDSLLSDKEIARRVLEGRR